MAKPNLLSIIAMCFSVGFSITAEEIRAETAQYLPISITTSIPAALEEANV
ncbi:hypothetical protein MCEMIH15_00626 [Caulobacteraceae bacterium]